MSKTESGSILASIKPMFANAIYAGMKTAELRSHGPVRAISEIYIYTTAPKSAVTGYITVNPSYKMLLYDAVDRLGIDAITGGAMGVDQLMEYFSITYNSRNPLLSVFEITGVVEFESSVSLREIMYSPASQHNFKRRFSRPPQGWRYLAAYEASALREWGGSHESEA